MTCSCITALKNNYLIGCEGKQFLRLDQIYLPKLAIYDNNCYLCGRLIISIYDKKRIPYHYEIPLGLLRGIYSNSTNNFLSATAEVS